MLELAKFMHNGRNRYVDLDTKPWNPLLFIAMIFHELSYDLTYVLTSSLLHLKKVCLFFHFHKLFEAPSVFTTGFQQELEGVSERVKSSFKPSKASCPAGAYLL